MSATFAATFSAVAVSAAQDVFELVAPSNSRVAIRSISLGQFSDAGDAGPNPQLALVEGRGHISRVG